MMKRDPSSARRFNARPILWSLGVMALVGLLAGFGCGRPKPPPTGAANPLAAVSNAYPPGVTNHFEEFDKSHSGAANVGASEPPTTSRKASEPPPMMEKSAPAPADTPSRAIPDPMDIK